MQPDLKTILDFLSYLHTSGLGYSALNSARSALSVLFSFDGKPVGQHPLVIRLLKGAFQIRPSFPKTGVIWDTEILLTQLRKMSPVKDLSFADLTKKLATLIWLLTGQRSQTIALLDLRNMSVSKGGVKLRVGDTLKTTKPGSHLGELNIKAYAPDRRLCITTILREYLLRTKPKRNKCYNLFISLLQPHWVSDILRRSGIDMSIYTPHTRQAPAPPLEHKYHQILY